MSAKSTNQLDGLDGPATSTADKRGERALEVTVMSFGYKQGPPPLANVVFDVRFLKNPFWIEELRPLTGLDKPVQEYVLEQPMAQDFLESLSSLLNRVLPKVVEHKVHHYIIALGCTGGQHRSTALVEALAARLKENIPNCTVTIQHRELFNNAIATGATGQKEGDSK